MPDWIHNRTHDHDTLKKAGVGEVHICAPRLVGSWSATYQPEGTQVGYDVRPELLAGLVGQPNAESAIRYLTANEKGTR
jgi:hypothetical protein